MNKDHWMIIAAIIIPFLTVILDWSLHRWFPGPRPSQSPPTNATIATAKSNIQKEIRRQLIFPSWVFVVVSLVMLSWNVSRTEVATGSDVLYIVAFSFVFVISLGFVVAGHLVAAIARVREELQQKSDREHPKTM